MNSVCFIKFESKDHRYLSGYWDGRYYVYWNNGGPFYPKCCESFLPGEIESPRHSEVVQELSARAEEQGLTLQYQRGIR
jgi:hypothetical protein